MQLFVDNLGADRNYQGAHGASWVHPSIPTVALSALFGEGGWLYHVEGGRFITAATLRETPLMDMDTLVVVAPGNLALADPAAPEMIDRLWQRFGGPARRVAHAGMPRSERAALAAYAQ